MLKLQVVLLMFFVLCGCEHKKSASAPNATLIIEKAIETSGVSVVSSAEIDFDFRDIHYHAKRINGNFELSRTFTRNDSVITDVLNNSDFGRFLNDSLLDLNDVDKAKYISSVNSVHYFSVLPFGLDDKAVNHRYIDSTVVKGKPYHLIEITFNEIGGGEDFQDVFLYWISRDNFNIDYLAYRYFTDGGGVRFREAFNQREIEGITFLDYRNYKPETKLVELKELPALFETNNLELLSTIELKNIQVQLIDNQ